ncbi:putative IQ motif, EF-hand binding, myosin head, motor domain, kinesin motor domain superfamily [Plasmopara halstedii]
MTMQVRVGDLYWKQDGVYGWILGQVTAFDPVRQSATFVHVNETTGARLCRSELNENEHIELHVELQETSLLGANPLFSTADDMTSLRYLHEAALAKNLQDRATVENQRPYTFMANVLIAVNPLRPLSDPEKMDFIGQSLDHCPPHPYNVAENAYRQLCAVRAVMQNQSIIISGESGSGKTETSKMILDFLTMRAVHNPALSTSSCTSNSDDELDFEVAPPPNSLTMALSFPQSIGKRKLSPVAIGERLMETIPILESFGNAKTHRNHNSSRFGKYMRLQFASDTHELTGASIDTYLLEKSRLVFQPQGERNFHIFYELLHADDLETLESCFHLKPQKPECYAYLNQSGCFHSESLDDATNFRNLKKALDFIGIRERAQYEIFRLVAGLLHMGNIQISQEDTDEGETACIRSDDLESQSAVRHASELLGVSIDQLIECILHKRIMTRGSRRNSIYFIKRDVRNAVYSRDTIAKTIYENTFTWLMGECAAALDYDSFRSDVVPYIGVLDIFGFEDFEPKNRNSFEQLLINYANETLQSLFNSCIFEAEQELYKSEHIYHPTNHSLSFPFSFAGDITPKTNLDNDIDFLTEQVTPSGNVVAYSDNRECLNLIASRHGGLFATIDNVSRLPMPSDRKLNERLHTLFKRHPCFPTPHPKDQRDTFLIRHYAGTVSYTINSFVDKNNNIISEQFEELLKNSTSRVLQDLHGNSRTSNRVRSESMVSTKSADQSPLGGGAASSKRLKGGSTSNLFSTQMKGLTTELEGTSCNFVRCIKPNTQMQPGLFDRSFVVEQLRCSGTVQACEVLRVGLPTRILYAEVVDVYRTFVPYNVFCRFNSNDKLFTQAILWVYDFPTSAFRLGDTRLFFRTGKIDLLDKLLTPARDTTANLGDQLLLYLRKKRWITAVTTIITYTHLKRLFEQVRYQRRATLLQCWVRQYLARKRVRTLRVQLRMHGLWTQFMHKAQILHAYQDRPEDKMVLLTKLLTKTYLPPPQRWLLKWLGPLQRVLYLQKRWNKIKAQYLAKRGFLWLYQSVRQHRSALLLQSSVRVMLARSRFLKLKHKALARRRWHLGFLKVQVVNVFYREYHRIHVKRLEIDNKTLITTMATVTRKLGEAQDEAKTAKLQLKALQVSFDTVQTQAKVQQQRVEELELALQAKRHEVAELQRQRAGGTFVERVVRFFTCSAAISPPASPREMLIPSRLTLLRRQTQSAAEETFDHGERIVWATPLSDTLVIPQDEGSIKRPSRVNTGTEEPIMDPEAQDFRSKDADLLWSLSRYMF